MRNSWIDTSTICALSTAPGSGAIAVIRVSGPDAIRSCNAIFSKDITQAKGYSVVYGSIVDQNRVVDDVVLTLFRGPNSFTGEDTVEIACHGSKFIQQEILKLLMSQGLIPARAGEFTMRAFANGKMDLSQAEAVADLIASESAAAHHLAMHQLKGGFSKQINNLREQLINFASLIELELDFSEEDVEFADRSQLLQLVAEIHRVIEKLIRSFDYGNAIKNGVPVAIVGVPNVGKSTLLNALLEEDKAIVSDIAGTTRDAIEDTMIINGIEFRFIDTAGLRETTDIVESIGIEKTWKKINEASIVLYLVDALSSSSEEIRTTIEAFREYTKTASHHFLMVINKTDQWKGSQEALLEKFNVDAEKIVISARDGKNLDELKLRLFHYVEENGKDRGDVVVTNVRHLNALQKAMNFLNEVETGMKSGLSGDLLAEHLRMVLYHLGEITGEISTEDLLGNIFSKFCIGK